MSDLEKILQLVQKNDGYITTKEVVDNGLNKMALKRLCDGGILKRVSTGYYSLPNMINDDYYKIILTDEKDIPDVIGKLRTVYKNIMRLEYKGATVNSVSISNDVSYSVENKSPMELFEQLYKLQNNRDMDTEEKSFLKNIMEEVWEENPWNR